MEQVRIQYSPTSRAGKVTSSNERSIHKRTQNPQASILYPPQSSRTSHGDAILEDKARVLDGDFPTMMPFLVDFTDQAFGIPEDCRVYPGQEVLFPSESSYADPFHQYFPHKSSARAPGAGHPSSEDRFWQFDEYEGVVAPVNRWSSCESRDPILTYQSLPLNSGACQTDFSAPDLGVNPVNSGGQITEPSRSNNPPDVLYCHHGDEGALSKDRATNVTDSLTSEARIGLSTVVPAAQPGKVLNRQRRDIMMTDRASLFDSGTDLGCVHDAAGAFSEDLPLGFFDKAFPMTSNPDVFNGERPDLEVTDIDKLFEDEGL
jgi:hypothetical protein